MLSCIVYCRVGEAEDLRKKLRKRLLEMLRVQELALRKQIEVHTYRNMQRTSSASQHLSPFHLTIRPSVRL